ncbi:unnamed protein product [Penicillium pancosmium]
MSSNKGYDVTGSGTNSQVLDSCARALTLVLANNGSYYYSNPDGSTYYNNGSGGSTYTPSGSGSSSSSKK